MSSENGMDEKCHTMAMTCWWYLHIYSGKLLPRFSAASVKALRGRKAVRASIGFEHGNRSRIDAYSVGITRSSQGG
jgi:hypothetical protein